MTTIKLLNDDECKNFIDICISELHQLDFSELTLSFYSDQALNISGFYDNKVISLSRLYLTLIHGQKQYLYNLKKLVVHEFVHYLLEKHKVENPHLDFPADGHSAIFCCVQEIIYRHIFEFNNGKNWVLRVYDVSDEKNLFPCEAFRFTAHVLKNICFDSKYNFVGSVISEYERLLPFFHRRRELQKNFDELEKQRSELLIEVKKYRKLTEREEHERLEIF